MRFWRAFLTALQFLTRIQLVKQNDWQLADFGRSTAFFTLVGVILGAIYWGISTFLLSVVGKSQLIVAIMVLLPIFLTGGLMLDGFMDTVDGVFSGRSRERQLAIMKDSRVGSFGAIALVALLLVQWSALGDIDLVKVPAALFAMPIVGRMAMVVAIVAFPYARPEGMGKVFADYANKWFLIFAGIVALAALIPWGVTAIIALGIGLFAAWAVADWLTNQLGGLTGDTYGAIETVTETTVLLVFWLEAMFA